MSNEILCPKCNGPEWKAVEQFTALTGCRLNLDDQGNVEIEFDPMAELAREAATSVTTAYICATCEHMVTPDGLSDLGKEQRDG